MDDKDKYIERAKKVEKELIITPKKPKVGKSFIRFNNRIYQ